MLTEMQKKLLEGTFDYIFSTICDETPETALKALAAMTDATAYSKYKSELEAVDLLALVDTVIKIYAHPCPQNRALGSPYVGQTPGLVAWEPNGHGNGVERELVGILGLTAHNVEGVEKVTKQDVCDYLDNEIAHYRLEVTTRSVQSALNDPGDQPNAGPSHHLDAPSLLTFIQAVIAFHAIFKNELQNHGSAEPSAAASYMTSVLNAIRKDAWNLFLTDPMLFSIPLDLKSFIEKYVEAHPILMSAKTYAAATKKLETQFNSDTTSHLTHLQTVTTPKNIASFWSSLSGRSSTLISFKEFVRVTCLIIESLQQRLSVFQNLDLNTARDYIVNVLKALGQNKLKEFLNDPSQFNAPGEYTHLLTELIQHHPQFVDGHTIGKEELQVLKLALKTMPINRVRQVFDVQASVLVNEAQTSSAPQPSQ